MRANVGPALPNLKRTAQILPFGYFEILNCIVLHAARTGATEAKPMPIYIIDT